MDICQSVVCIQIHEYIMQGYIYEVYNRVLYCAFILVNLGLMYTEGNNVS